MFENAVAFFMVGALILYALMAGADVGGGFWDLLARGRRSLRQRAAIAHAIGPIWEANHVWLILVIVILFTGFRRGFAALMTALNIPLTLMLIGTSSAARPSPSGNTTGAADRCSNAGASFSARPFLHSAAPGDDLGRARDWENPDR